MRVVWKWSLILLIKLIILLSETNANEVLGCGGFIKSHADIDFSKVEIKLLTKQGSLKDKTDCSPSNGYYFLPIYDKGEYLLKISPPPGWSFQPEQVELNFDGSSDICSKGKDVNFVFKGFGITGKVALAGNTVGGARNVHVELTSEDGKDVRRTHTDINGVFSFTPVVPGKYIVSASHPKWYFSKSQHTVVVTTGNTELPHDALIVSGFDVLGRFDISEPLPNKICMAIFNRKGQNLPLLCHQRDKKENPIETSDYETTSACYTDIDKNGHYNFKGVPPGNYILMPIVENGLQVFFNSQYIEIDVGRDTLQVPEKLKVIGFTVSGIVLAHANGGPLPGATVKMNSEKVAESDENGIYHLNAVKSGTFLVQVDAPKMQFEEKHVKLQIDIPNIPPIYPTAFEICGRVIAKKIFTVGVGKVGSTFYTKTTTHPDTGDWCVFLGVGEYSAEVVTTKEDVDAGVQFYPAKHFFEVRTGPIGGIIFSQLRALISGEIRCLPDAPESCMNGIITLNGVDNHSRPTDHKETVRAVGGRFSFKDVLPGLYMVQIPQNNICFDTTRSFFSVEADTYNVPTFIQRGYEVSIISSHRAIVKYQFQDPAGDDRPPHPIETVKVVAGMNTVCVQRYGYYTFKIESCHLFDEQGPSTFNTMSSEPVVLNAVAHKIGIRILSSEPNAEDLQLEVETAVTGKNLIKPIAEAHKVDDKYAFRYDTYLKPEEVLKIIPRSDILLFNPPNKELIGGNDCIDIAFNFIANRGLILRGKVVPAIKDVEITLVFPNNPDIEAKTTTTLVTGEFKFGPIDSTLDFDLTARKDSYVFSDYDRQTASFTAHKLCEIIVKVKDDSGEPLSGVLLSLSGAESYRKNLVTGDDGTINFHSLSPSQYFLRPMMKEYKFEPNSKMIDIKDGETLEVELIGKRHAYSVFGTVAAPNGEPFPSVNVEATADEKCMYHQEEATSELNGQFRIRGLQPGCIYSIYLKDAGQPNSNIERSLPEKHTIEIGHEDVKDIHLMVIPYIGIADVVARITASSKEFYKTLRLIMYRKGAMDSPIYSQKVDSPLDMKSRLNPGIMVFLPRIPLDGKTYILELRSTLSDKTYKYSTPTAQFVADIGSTFIHLDFNPEIRSTETELNQNSIGALVLVTLLALAFFKQDIAMNVLDYLWSKVASFVDNLMHRHASPSSSRRDKKIDTMSQREIEQLADQINSMKKKKAKKI